MNVNRQGRWLLALAILAVVIAASAAIALNYRDSPGGIPLQAVSDGSGGAIIAWQKESGIYVQHIDASGRKVRQNGSIRVTEAGIKLDIYAPSRTSFRLIADGLGGAFITWDERYKMPNDRNDPAFFNPAPFRSQHISSNGELLWQETLIATGGAEPYGGEFPVVIADGTGGAIFAWNAYTTAYRALHNDFLCLQKLAPDGARLWGEQGILLVSSSPYHPVSEGEKSAGIKGSVVRSYPTYGGKQDIVSDGAGGVIVIWEEEGKDADTVYAQRLNSEGSLVWEKNVPAGSGRYWTKSLRSDGSGGAVLTISGNDAAAAYQQHVGSNGEILETKEYIHDTVSDGQGGYFRVRVEADPPAVFPHQKRSIIYVQRINPALNLYWPEKQVLATEQGYQTTNPVFAADGAGGITLIWQLQKEITAYGGLFAQNIDGEGNIRWGENGINVFNRPDKYQANGIIIDDGSGGTLVVAVAGNNSLGGDMVYAQHLDREGKRLWGDGVRVDR